MPITRIPAPGSPTRTGAHSLVGAVPRFSTSPAARFPAKLVARSHTLAREELLKSAPRYSILFRQSLLYVHQPMIDGSHVLEMRVAPLHQRGREHLAHLETRRERIQASVSQKSSARMVEIIPSGYAFIRFPCNGVWPCTTHRF